MSKTPLPSALGIAFLGAFVAAGQHAHINAGVNAASTLAFANADRFAADSGFVVRLPAVTNGVYGGYHIANSPTFTALASTPINGGPVPALNVTTGIVSIPAQTPAGTYYITYQICEEPNPTNCDGATITVTVSAAAILAVDDAAGPVNGANGGNAGINVLGNDKLNGVLVIPSQVTITSTPTAELKVNTDGTVTVTPGTQDGTYYIDWLHCVSALTK